MADKGYGIEINSATRNKGSKGSDHYQLQLEVLM